MSKSLLVEYIPFKPIGKINEDMGAQFGVPGGLVVQGVLQRAGAKNQNGRVYPKNILNREAQKYQKEYIDQSLFDAGITLGISSRGLGSVKELYKESAVEVQEDFELICFDFVSNPSTHGAFLRPMTESVNKNKQNNYLKVNEIITSILCDDGKCRI